MGPKCPAIRYIVNGEENPQTFPFLLGFRHPAGGGPSHGDKQHAQKMVKIARVVRRYARGQTDRQTQTDRHSDVHITASGEVTNSITCLLINAVEMSCD